MLPRPRRPRRLDRWWLTATGSVAVAVLLASTLSPGPVSRTPPDHIPLAALVDWFWGSVAIAYLASAGPGRADATLAVSVGVLWLAVAATSNFAPSLVTGSDPTTVPVAALVAPVGEAEVLSQVETKSTITGISPPPTEPARLPRRRVTMPPQSAIAITPKPSCAPDDRICAPERRP